MIDAFDEEVVVKPIYILFVSFFLVSFCSHSVLAECTVSTIKCCYRDNSDKSRACCDECGIAFESAQNSLEGGSDQSNGPVVGTAEILTAQDAQFAILKARFI